MTENGALAARQDRRHPPTFTAYGRMTDGVGPSMDAVEPSCLYTPVNARPGETSGSELPTRDDAMLPCGDLGDLQVWPVAFVSHSDTKATGG